MPFFAFCGQYVIGAMFMRDRREASSGHFIENKDLINRGFSPSQNLQQSIAN
jgi:hypothetical protein